MTFRLVLRKEAARDMREAFDYFEGQGRGLGKDFVAKVQKVFDRITLMPTLHGFVEDDIRRALVKKYHYSVFYRIEGMDVAVLAVVHQRRDPAVWQGRK